MTEFNWQVRHWATVAEFEATLRNTPRPRWATGITDHHTDIPTVAQWRQRGGWFYMALLGRYYKSLGWSAGPHLFIAPDGIWQGTPITRVGVHAGVCNSTRFGIEIVGNYDGGPWLEPICSLAFGVNAALVKWIGKTETCINGHRDCNSTKTCPGAAISMDGVRSKVRLMLAEQGYKPLRYRVVVDVANVRQGPSTRYPVAGQMKRGEIALGDKIIADGGAVNEDTRWLHLANHWGFVHLSVLASI